MGQNIQSLVNKSISAVGWRLLGQDEIRELASSRQGWPRVINLWDLPLPAANSTGPLAAMAVKEEMPVSDWSLSGIAPDAHFRSATGRFWWAVTLPTDKLFRLFPRPLINANLDKFHIEHLTPDVAISVVLDDTNDRHPARSGPGKPKKANGAIERACHELFGKRLAAGEKELALASHAAEFVQKVWGEKLSRTTFQEYMKAFRPQKSKGSANVPEIMPENSGK